MKPINRKRLTWELSVALILVLASIILNLVHYEVFRSFEHIWLWGLTSLAFLPISVLVMTLLIDRLLSARETALRLDKLNMLIGAFFSNVGTELLARFSCLDPGVQDLHQRFGSPDSWKQVSIRQIEKTLSRYKFEISADRNNLFQLREYLTQKLDFLMRLLENPILLEHEKFTELLRAVFHLTEELTYRSDIASIPDSDVEHLVGDIKRVYALLVREWAAYIIYLRDNYPYLFSLSVRTNPLDRTATPIVKGK